MLFKSCFITETRTHGSINQLKNCWKSSKAAYSKAKTHSDKSGSKSVSFRGYGWQESNHYSPSLLFQPKKTAALLCAIPCKGPIVIPLSLSRFFSSLTLIIHYSVKADGLCGGQSGWRYICGEHCDQRLRGNDWLSRLRIDGIMVASLLLT